MLTIIRRSVLLSGATAWVAGVTAKASAEAASAVPVQGGPSYPFTLPPLPYAADANEPHIDARTMELHHDKHHAAYVANLNAAMKDYPAVAAMALGTMLGRIGELPQAVQAVVRNNGGGHAYHSMFWQIMGGQGGDPDGDVATAITRDFGSFAQLKEAFNSAGAKQFGSGWTLVLVDQSGKLHVEARPNQDFPLMNGKIVLFGNDVWEHAYYLKYQNRRADYLTAWWNVVNWQKINDRYSAAKAGTLVI